MSKKRIWTEEEKLKIKSLYLEDGIIMKEIGIIYKTKSATISNILKSKNVPIKRTIKNRFFNHDFFEIINTEEKAYFLGLLTADGNISLDIKRNPMIRIELIDKEILEELKIVTNMTTEVRMVLRENRAPTYIWSIRSKKMAKDLKKLGIEPNKTELMMSINKTIKKDLKRHYIRGLIDGDGSIYYSKNSHHISFTTKHKEFADSVREVLDEFSNKSKSNKVTCYNGVHKITYSGKDAVRICSVLYSESNFSIKRKKDIADKM